MHPLPLKGKRALITGATAGIGAATAEAFCNAGVKDLYVVGRRADRLAKLANEWANEHGTHVHPIALDIRHRDDLEELQRKHPRIFDVDILVNNAGLARGTDPMHEAKMDDWQEMVETNVLALLSITRLALPKIIERQGHVVNLGSVAGRWTYPGGGVYCASKAAVHAITEGLRLDLQGTGVRVSNIAPGLVETEFSDVRFRGDTKKAAKVYADADVLQPEDVAEAIVWTCGQPARVNIQEMVIYPTCQAGVRDVIRES